MNPMALLALNALQQTQQASVPTVAPDMSGAVGLSSRNFLALQEQLANQRKADVAAQQNATQMADTRTQQSIENMLAARKLADAQDQFQQGHELDTRRVQSTADYNKALADHYAWQQSQPQYMKPGQYLMPDGQMQNIEPQGIDRQEIEANIAYKKALTAYYQNQASRVRAGEPADFSRANQRTKFWGDNWNALVRDVDTQLGIQELRRAQRPVPPELLAMRQELIARGAARMTKERLKDGTPYLPKNWPFLEPAGTPGPGTGDGTGAGPGVHVIRVEDLKEGW